MTQSVDTYRTREVEYYDPDLGNRVTSSRSYVVVSEIRGVQERSGYYYEDPTPVDTTLFLDPDTGLVVFDVGAYEKWLEKR